MESSLSSSESAEFIKKKEEERKLRWRTKGFLFTVYFILIIVPLTFMSIEIFYSNNVLGIFQIPNYSTRVILSLLFFVSALIGIYLVSFHILRMQIDKVLDMISLLFCLLFAVWWNYDFRKQESLYALASSNESFNMIFIFLGVFFVILSLFILNRPKYRFGFFLQVAGITMTANSFLLKLRMMEIASPLYLLALVSVVICSIAIFGYSVYYRVKFEYYFDKDY